MRKTYVIAGCGGIGHALAELLARMLMSSPADLYLIDGKAVRTANLARQFGASDIGENKANALARKLSAIVGDNENLNIIPVPNYLEPCLEAAHDWLSVEDPTVFLCVDTAASRVCIEDMLCKHFRSFTLIAGGNAEFDGQATFGRREKGKTKQPLPTEVNPDIRAKSDGRTPSMIPCDEQQVSEPQLVIANAQAAICMLSLWYGQILNTPKRADRRFNYVTFNVQTPEVFPSIRPALQESTTT